MSKFTEVIHDISTGETIILPFTEKQIAEAEALQKKLDEQQKQIQEKEKSRKSALAKLAALGLTEEEIAAL